MKKSLLAGLNLLLSITFGNAQNVGINTTGAPADPSSILDVSSTTGGLLLPRMPTVQRDAIASPATGLMIFNITTNCLQIYIGTWQSIYCGCVGAPATPGSITGSTSVTSGQSGVTYSITSVPDATGYTWTVPSGSSITSGQGTTAITVSFGSTSGNVCVTASNDCGTSSASCTAVTVTACPPGSQVFAYTGAVQTFTVPACVTSITVTALGAQGGGTAGGLGGRAIATIVVTPGETLNVYVGGQPTTQMGAGGYNGGGAITALPCGGGSDGWPGGGASDVRRGVPLANRVIVAGGGGGTGWSTGLGGAGGGTLGGDGAASWIAGTQGIGGSQVGGGAGGYYSGNGESAPSGTLGIGGNGGPISGYCIGGGGGGGYYGGGGGYVSAGGGGSSYVAYPGNTGTSTTAGVRSGNGQVTISW